MEQARQWAVRITHEAQSHKQNAFITLTYADEHLPEHNSLQYDDLQKFWKRMRKRFGKLSYYAVGEYGDTTKRPHYHACIFGHDFAEGRTILKTNPNLLWTHPALEAVWGLGHVSVGALTYQTASYTASYVTKKLGGEKQYVRLDVDSGELIPLIQPRAFMSLNPAIGKGWVEKYGMNVYDRDYVVIQGTRQKPPKMYDKWLAVKDEPKHQAMKENRKAKAKSKTPEQNRARAQNAHARAKNRKKTL